MKKIFVALIFTLSLTATQAQATLVDTPRSATLRYGVYAGGFQALDITLVINFAKGTYTSSMKANPAGLLGQLLPWAGEYKVNGMIAEGRLVPLHHEKISAWRDDRDHLWMDYKNGVLVSLKKEEKEGGKTVKRDETPDKSLHGGTIDMMTSILKMLIVADGKNSCTNSDVVFDGKRRFRMAFTDRGTEKLEKSKLNMFGGTARKCELELVPLAGFKGKPRGYYKIQEDARKLGKMPAVWLGRTEASKPYVPVRMLVKSEYGAIFIHLRNITWK